MARWGQIIDGSKQEEKRNWGVAAKKRRIRGRAAHTEGARVYVKTSRNGGKSKIR